MSRNNEYDEELTEIETEEDFDEESYCEDDSFEDESYEEDSYEEEPPRAPKKKRKINMHIALLITLVVVAGLIYYRISNWGTFRSQEDIFADGQGTYSDTLDLYLPLLDEEGMALKQRPTKDMNILVFGNAPFADDRDSKDSLEAIFEDMSGANVINCSISESYMGCVNLAYDPTTAPMDMFAPYWLLINIVTNGYNDDYLEWAQNYMGESTPADVPVALKNLKSTDFNDLDIIVFMYDGADYLLGHGMYSDDYSADISTFTGGLEAAIDLIQENFPQIRIIVMSPPYAFSDVKDENGKYISSDITRYGQDVLSTYVIKEYTSSANKRVTFVDNLYGTITEDEAEKYLTDHIHLNKKGRKKIAERLLYAIEYVNKLNK